MTSYEIPFNRARAFGDEMRYVAESLSTGHISSNGPFGAKCSALLEELLDGPRVLLTTSCTHALEICARLLDLEPGDEVVVPSFAFVSTAAAFALHGARPVFADVRPDTLNLDVDAVRAKLTDRTRAVVALHYAGVGCEMDALGDLCRERGVRLIEDAAHGLFGTYRGRPLGSFGDLGAVSFHETKCVTCGEGGALLVGDEGLLERARILRAKGTDRHRFEAGLVDAYTWVDHGSNYALSDLSAAFLYGQLEEREAIREHRRALWDRYDAELGGWAAAHGVGRPRVPGHCRHTSLLYYLVLPDRAVRDRLIAHLRSLGIVAAFHYPPLHLSRMGRRYGGRPGDCPVTERVSDCLVRLPLYNAMTLEDQTKVLGAILEPACLSG